jgi:biotin-(acetyl-CoA carboxylase) ligase
MLVALSGLVAQLAAAETGPPLARWRALSPSANGATVEWNSSGLTIRGSTAGLAEDGALLVRTATGLERIISGELRWL